MGKDLYLLPQVTVFGDHKGPYQYSRDQILNEKQAAVYLNLSVKTLQAWRYYSKGPRFVKLGKAVRYRKEDLDAFLDSSTVDPVA